MEAKAREEAKHAKLDRADAQTQTLHKNNTDITSIASSAHNQDRYRI
jgi:hypothetical protein